MISTIQVLHVPWIRLRPQYDNTTSLLYHATIERLDTQPTYTTNAQKLYVMKM